MCKFMKLAQKQKLKHCRNLRDKIATGTESFLRSCSCSFCQVRSFQPHPVFSSVIK